MFAENQLNMLRDWEKIDLSKATIFDLTDDMTLIREAECSMEEEDDPDPITHSQYSRSYQVSTMLSFAQIIKNVALQKAIESANENDMTNFDE